MTEIVVSRHGSVPRGFEELVRRVLSSFYSSLQGGPPFVEVVLYGPGHGPLDHPSGEAAGLGVLVTGEYPVSHEAWFGWPRIHVDYGRCSAMEPELLEALLVHEAAHSVLHGGRRYYELRVGRELLEELGPTYGLELLYLASTAVKDLEAHRYLVSAGYREYVERYARYSLGEAADLECSDPSEVLTLTKLLSPCVYVDCEGLIGSLSGGCARLLEPLLGILASLGSSEASWDERSVSLVRMVIDLPS